MSNKPPTARIVLAAGGTGGHIFPAIAVAAELKKLGAEVLFIGVGKDLEKKLIPAAGFRLEAIPFLPVTGHGIGRIGLLLLRLPGALLQGMKIFRAEKPNAVLAFGGYPSFVPFLISLIRCVPRALHEQNVQVGLANKLMAVVGQKIYAVPGAKGFFSRTAKRVHEVPNPVRSVFYAVPPWTPPEPGKPFRILVVGGSQGAVSLNSAVLECALHWQTHNVELVHQTGTQDFSRVSAFYKERRYHAAKTAEFLTDIATEYAAAHLIISRAGAMSAAEIAASGRPAIFVPLAIARAHQQENIGALVTAGAALTFAQDDKLASNLQRAVGDLLTDYPRLGKMAAAGRERSRLGEMTSAEFLATQILALAQGKAS